MQTFNSKYWDRLKDVIKFKGLNLMHLSILYDTILYASNSFEIY